MKLEVLVSAMYQNDYSLIKKMNIQSDAIIINQCNRNEYEFLKYNEKEVQFYSFAERGVGLSRNNALMRSYSDICIFSDEDVIFVDGYVDIICKAFNDNPEADIVIFNVPSINPERPSPYISENKRVRWFNSLKYGAVGIAIKTDKVKKENIFFSLLFGGGAKYGSGEDSLFIIDCIKKGLKIYTNKSIIGYVSQEESSWFKGYTDNYFYDKGALFASISKKWHKALNFQFAIKHRKLYRENKKITKVLKLMNTGSKEFLDS